MTLTTHIERAGKYPVVQIPCPDFAAEKVDLTAPRAAILHTTEGPWKASMGVFRVHYAPHFIVGLDSTGKPSIGQLVPVGIIGAACKAHNNKAIVEIEVVGYSKEVPWIFDDQTTDALASLMNVISDEWQVPLTRPWKDGDYGRYGDNPHRHSGKFGTISGWYGHGDMPAPDSHWDPGNLRWQAIFDHANKLRHAT